MIAPEKKIRSLILIIAFLLITNITLLLFLVSGRNSDNIATNRDLNIVGSFLKDSIGFDKKQMDMYQHFRKADFEKGKPVFDSIRAAKNRFYENIYSDSAADSTVNKSAADISKKQMAVDMHMLQHFRNLRSICTPKQLPKFDSLFKNIVEKVTLGRLKRHSNH